MSAFQLNDYSINALVTWANHYDRPHAMTGQLRDVEQLGEALKQENIKSVRFRYRDADAAGMIDASPFVWEPSTAPQLTPIAVIKLAQCLSYQSCEHDGWDKSEAHRAVRYIIDAAISELPGYREAAWGLTPPERLAAKPPTPPADPETVTF